MTFEVLAGGLTGLGLFLLIRALIPSKPDATSRSARCSGRSCSWAWL